MVIGGVTTVYSQSFTLSTVQIFKLFSAVYSTSALIVQSHDDREVGALIVKGVNVARANILKWTAQTVALYLLE